MQKEKPITAKLFSIEMVGSAIFTAFIVGGVYVGLEGRVQAQEDGLKQVRKEQKQNTKSIQEISTNVAVILERMKAADHRATRQEEATRRILDIIQTRYESKED